MKQILMSLNFLMILLQLTGMQARPKRIVVASESRQKVEAVHAAFSERFAPDTIQIITYKTFSRIPEQPVGRDVALKGARNRLEGISNDVLLLLAADYVVSIESYIEHYQDTSAWVDRGLIICKDLSQPQHEIVALTQPTFIPAHFVQLAQQMSGAESVTPEGYSITVGKAIQATFADRNIDPQDWHRETEFGGASRQQLLQNALFKMLHEQEIQFLMSKIVKYPDFPKPGIVFADFLPILQDAQTFKVCIDLLYERYKTKEISAIVGLESRGFIMGAALAYKLGVSFVPVRKSGKLPGQIYSINYEKEYGSDTLTISQQALQANQRVVIIDDLIATGGSARAAIDLVRFAGGMPVEFVSLLQVDACAEKAKLSIPAFNLLDDEGLVFGA